MSSIEIITIIGAILAVIGTIAFGLWLLKESRESDRDWETLRRFNLADAHARHAMHQYKLRREIRETAEKMVDTFGLEAAERYYDSTMALFIDNEDEIEKEKRKRIERLTLQDNQDEAIDSLYIWISQGGKMPRNP